MDIKSLKAKIENNDLDDSFMLWKCPPGSELVVSQYLRKIAENKHLVLKYIDSIDEIVGDSFLKDINLYVFLSKKYNEKYNNNNLIVICEETKNTDAIVFPKLEAWQVVDFAKSFLPGVNIEMLNELIKGYSEYQLFISDMEKLAIFDEEDQNYLVDDLFDQLSITPTLTVFDLSNALLRHDIKLAREVLKVKDRIDLTPMHLLTILLNNVKKVLDIQLGGNNVRASDLGISDKQFFVIKKYNCGIYSNAKLISIYETLLDIENKFKFKELEVCDIIDYIVCKILGD